MQVGFRAPAVFVSAALLIGCSRGTTPPAVQPQGGAAPARDKPAAQPDAQTKSANSSLPFAIEATSEYKLADGGKMRLWQLRGHALKELKAELLIISDGKVQKAGGPRLRWEKWDKDLPAAAGQLILLVQDGRTFGVKGKRRPHLVLDVQGAPEADKSASQANVVLEGELEPLITDASYVSPLPEKKIIFFELYGPKGETAQVRSSELDVLVEASKKGRTVLAVNLEWQPQ